MPLIGPVRSGESVSRSRFLTRTEEVELFRQVEAGGSAAQRAKNIIAERSQPLVRSLATRFLGRGLRMEDLVQEGNFGLLSAMDYFDHTRGVKFSTYAYKCIQSSIISAVYKGGREKFRSLDSPLYAGEERGPTLYDRLPGKGQDLQALIDGSQLRTLLFAVLLPRERGVMELLLQDLNYSEAGRNLGYCRERVRQIEKDALAKFREAYDIIETVGLSNIESPRKLRLFLKWRLVMRRAAKKALDNNPERYLRICDILKEAKTPKMTFQNVRRNDPGIRKIVIEAIEESWRRKLAKAVAAAREGLSEGKPTPQHKTAQLAGITHETLIKIIRRRPQLLPPGVKFKSAMRGAGKEARILAKISELVGRGVVFRDKRELGRQLGVCDLTLRRWEGESGEIRKAIEDLVSIERNFAYKLAKGYNQLAAPERDLGLNPIGVPELAAAMGYRGWSLRDWIISSPGVVSPSMTLHIRRGYSQDLVFEHRRRRVGWALEFSRESGFQYLDVAEFGQERLGMTWQSFKIWLKEDPELIKVFEAYVGVINPRRIQITRKILAA